MSTQEQVNAVIDAITARLAVSTDVKVRFTVLMKDDIDLIQTDFKSRLHLDKYELFAWSYTCNKREFALIFKLKTPCYKIDLRKT